MLDKKHPLCTTRDHGDFNFAYTKNSIQQYSYMRWNTELWLLILHLNRKSLFDYLKYRKKYKSVFHTYITTKKLNDHTLKYKTKMGD